MCVTRKIDISGRNLYDISPEPNLTVHIKVLLIIRNSSFQGHRPPGGNKKVRRKRGGPFNKEDRSTGNKDAQSKP